MVRMECGQWKPWVVTVMCGYRESWHCHGGELAVEGLGCNTGMCVLEVLKVSKNCLCSVTAGVS